LVEKALKSVVSGAPWIDPTLDVEGYSIIPFSFSAMCAFLKFFDSKTVNWPVL